MIDGGTIRLQKLIGLSRALDLILTGRTLNAKEAFDIGLANRIVPPKSALNIAMEISQEMATLPQRCLRVDRMSVYNAAFEGKSLEENLNFEYEHGKSVINVESIEGAKRFIHSKEK